MNAARKLARLKLAAAGAPIVLLAFAPALLSKLFPISPKPLAVCFLVLIIASIANYIYFVFVWRPKCPHCKVQRARFTRIDDDEYVVCSSCGYEEKTGWTYD